MKKIVLLIAFFAATFTGISQVGINTVTPQGVLDVVSTNSGIVLPRVANTAAVTAPVNGMLIYDLSSNCAKSYENGAWSDCLSTAGATASATVSVVCDGFLGTYCSSGALSGTTYRVTMTNNDFASKQVTPLTADLTLSGITGATVTAVSPSAATTINAGASLVISYTIGGTLTGTGTLTGSFTKQSLTCSSNVVVGGSRAVAAASSAPTICSGSSLPAITHATTNAQGIGSASGLPAGVTAAWASNTITISGTPTDSGTFNYSIVVNGCGAAVNATGTITVLASPGNYSLAATAVTMSGSAITGFTANWTALSGATGYTLEYSTAASGPWTAFASNPYSGTSASVTGLSAIVYHFRVTSIGGVCAGAQAIQVRVVGCGAFVAAGVFKAFACYNLGAYNTTSDPNIPTRGNNGSYYQWGRNAPAATVTATTDAIIGSWGSQGGTSDNGNWRPDPELKGTQDPCPTGYRVPSRTEWDGVRNASLNTVSRTNPWTTGSSTNFSNAIHFGPSASVKTLTLPAAGLRSTTGTPNSRGVIGYYWSSTEGSNSGWYLNFSNSIAGANNITWAMAFSVRCVSE
jgi:uncharacterized protein (TIGR02145 family)